MNVTRNTQKAAWKVPFVVALLGVILTAPSGWGRSAAASCGTYLERVKEELLAHRMSESARQGERLWRTLNGLAAIEESKGANKDIGEIAVLEEDAGIVSRRNLFNLTGRSLQFAPVAGGYQVRNLESNYSLSEQLGGETVEGLGDDDTREYTLGFDFSYYGTRYRKVYVNSDGNLSFEAGDGSSRERSLGRLLSGPPRIGGFFADLDPSRAGSVVVFSRADRFVVTWLSVPEYGEFGVGARNTFQIRLLASGAVEFAYADINMNEVVVGIAPGRLSGGSSVVSFQTLSGNPTYAGAVAERFRATEEIDTVTVAQRFFETHEDAYDYLAIYNTLGISPGPGTVAFEVTVRNQRSGYGDVQLDYGREYGSPRRLQAVLNMGPLSQYPRDPNGILASRLTARDTPTTVLAHEAGHLFLAFASVRDPNNPTNPVMLGRQSAHWAFTFNSEASLLEGNRILDRGPGVSPRFETVGVTEQYSPLDQYLMGLRAKEEVGPLFYVSGSGVGNFFSPAPQLGVSFDGRRQDVTVDDLIAVHGRRTPDHTVSQRKFRFAIILVTQRGVEPSAAVLEQVEGYRRNFESFYNRATGTRASAEATLRRKLDLSVWPAAGVVAGRDLTATLRIEKALNTSLSVALRAARGLVEVPTSVTLPAGSTSATFRVRGVRAGVEDLSATANDGSFAAGEAKLQVLEAARQLRIEIVAGDGQVARGSERLEEPLVVRVMDENRLPYPGVRVLALAAGNGVVEPASAAVGEDGQASFRWTPAAAPLNKLQFSIEGVSASEVSVTATAFGRPFLTSQTVGNAASFAPGLTAWGLHTIFGANLASKLAVAPFPWPSQLEGVRVLVNGREQPIVFVSGEQINFYLADAPGGSEASVEVETNLGSSGTVRVPVQRVQPGIFFQAGSGEGAVLRRGNFLEIYATGLGSVTQQGAFHVVDAGVEALWNGAPLRVVFAGLAPGFVGLYQVNAEVPGNAGGVNRLRLRVGGVASNEVRVSLQ